MAFKIGANALTSIQLSKLAGNSGNWFQTKVSSSVLTNPSGPAILIKKMLIYLKLDMIYPPSLGTFWVYINWRCLATEKKKNLFLVSEMPIDLESRMKTKPKKVVITKSKVPKSIGTFIWPYLSCLLNS